MTAARILRRPAQADERIALGTSPLLPTAAAQVAVSIADPLTQMVEEHSRRVEQLEARSRETQQECDELRAAKDALEAEIATVRESARQEGSAKGLEMGRAQAQQEAAANIAEWRKAIEEGVRRYESAVQTLQSQLGEVVMAAIAKLLGDHSVNAPAIRAAIEQTLREAGSAVSGRVLIAPSQYEQLVRLGSSHLTALRERRIEVAPDPRVTSGGCMIETASGLIDGRFEGQLQRLKDIVTGHFSGATK